MITRSVLRGALAGAAGTTALNGLTYFDMVVRGRPASETPSKTIEAAASALGFTVPGDEQEAQNRIAGLGSLTGLATGVVVGAIYGLGQGFGVRLPRPAAAGALAALAMVLANGPMTALGVTDPRRWTLVEWLSDVGPHVGYGCVAALCLPT